MAAAQAHEIAFHGASHIPWDDLDADALSLELAILAALEGPADEFIPLVDLEQFIEWRRRKGVG